MHSFTRRILLVSTLAGAVVALTACPGEKPTGEQPSAAATPAPSAGASGSATPLNPDPGGKVVTVELTTDGVGSYFKPAEVKVKRGDVVRFTLKVGVHNVHFLADSNAGRSGYPASPS